MNVDFIASEEEHSVLKLLYSDSFSINIHTDLKSITSKSSRIVVFISKNTLQLDYSKFDFTIRDAIFLGNCEEVMDKYKSLPKIKCVSIAEPYISQQLIEYFEYFSKYKVDFVELLNSDIFKIYSYINYMLIHSHDTKFNVLSSLTPILELSTCNRADSTLNIGVIGKSADYSNYGRIGIEFIIGKINIKLSSRNLCIKCYYIDTTSNIYDDTVAMLEHQEIYLIIYLDPITNHVLLSPLWYSYGVTVFLTGAPTTPFLNYNFFVIDHTLYSELNYLMKQINLNDYQLVYHKSSTSIYNKAKNFYDFYGLTYVTYELIDLNCFELQSLSSNTNPIIILLHFSQLKSFFRNINLLTNSMTLYLIRADIYSIVDYFTIPTNIKFIVLRHHHDSFNIQYQTELKNFVPNYNRVNSLPDILMYSIRTIELLETYIEDLINHNIDLNSLAKSMLKVKTGEIYFKITSQHYLSTSRFYAYWENNVLTPKEELMHNRALDYPEYYFVEDKFLKIPQFFISPDYTIATFPTAYTIILLYDERMQIYFNVFTKFIYDGSVTYNFPNIIHTVNIKDNCESSCQKIEYLFMKFIKLSAIVAIKS